MSENPMVGVPDDEAEYFARIEFGRTGTDEKPEKIYLHFEYPNLPYGAMVGIQKMMQEQVLPDLVTQGELVAEMMGQPVMGMDEIKSMLQELKKQRPPQGRGKA